ncbi:MAG: hypothetical protein HKN15_01345 [Xanthomonadales bacterium]|nr:hypothetical protein [Xanthomonadales bacterium]
MPGIRCAQIAGLLEFFQRLDVFFPLAPSPKHIEIVIHHPSGGDLIVTDTHETLKGLHLENPENADSDNGTE